MESCYINGIGCISAQKSFEDDFLSDPIFYSNENILGFVKPDYKEYISPSAVRRMSPGIKNSIVASSLAMRDAKIESLDAIITGTGMGCIHDSKIFLSNLINNEEEFLTPTSFIQSTHNTVGGQIALALNCKAYNFTYVNTSISFESALLDGIMQIENSEAKNILVGGVDETTAHVSELYKLIEQTKSDTEAPYDILNKRTKGSISGEGATFFVLNNEKTPHSYCELKGVTFVNTLESSNLMFFIKDFLDKNGLTLDQINALILGNNGDVDFDTYYDIVEKEFSNASVLFYKHLFGEFMTSSSISVWLASKILKKQLIPKVLFKGEAKKTDEKIEYILIYNQYRGKDHSLMLLKNV